MKNPARMSKRELKNEVCRHRQTLAELASGELGTLAQQYQVVARDALRIEEHLDSREENGLFV